METKQSFAGKLISYLNIILRIVVLVLIIILLHATYKGLKQEGYIVETIQVPKHFSDSGLNGVVVAKQIQDRIKIIKEEVGKSREDQTLILATNTNNLDIDVMGIGVSSRSLIYHLRDFLGIKTRSIGGDLVALENKLTFSLRVTDFPVKKISINGDSLSTEEEAHEELIDQIAESVLFKLDPYYLAFKLIREKNVTKAKAVMREMIANRPGEAKWAYAAWGNLKYEQNEFEGAKEYLNKALEIDPAFEMPKSLLAWIHSLSGENEVAIGLFEELLANNHKGFGVINGLAISHREMGNWDKAEEYYKMQIEEHPGNIFSYGNYNSFLINLKKDTAAAIQVFKDAGEKIPINDDYYVTRAMHFFHKEDPDSARIFLDRALDYNDNNIGALQAMTGYLSNIKNDYEAADEYYFKMIEVLIKYKYEPLMLSSAYNRLAMNDHKRKDLVSAEKHVNQAIEAFPKNGIVYTTLGEIEYLKGNQRKMIEAFKKAFDFGVIFQEEWLEDPLYREMIRTPGLRKLVDAQKLKG